MLFRSNDTATTEIYTRMDTLSLYDALPICRAVLGGLALATVATLTVVPLFYNILQPQNARDASLLPHEENS